MGKIIYTERDIEKISQSGIKEIEVNNNVVLTDLAYEAAKKLQIRIFSFPEKNQKKERINIRGLRNSSGVGAIVQISSSQLDGLKHKINKEIKNKVSDHFDDAKLDHAIEEVLKSTPYSK